MKKRDTGAPWVLLDSEICFFQRESAGLGSELMEVGLCPKNIRFLLFYGNLHLVSGDTAILVDVLCIKVAM